MKTELALFFFPPNICVQKGRKILFWLAFLHQALFFPFISCLKQSKLHKHSTSFHKLAAVSEQKSYCEEKKTTDTPHNCWSHSQRELKTHSFQVPKRKSMVLRQDLLCYVWKCFSFLSVFSHPCFFFSFLGSTCWREWDGSRQNFILCWDMLIVFVSTH